MRGSGTFRNATRICFPSTAVGSKKYLPPQIRCVGALGSNGLGYFRGGTLISGRERMW
jgi:hypothetical protein